MRFDTVPSGMNTRTWLHGLIAAFLGGGASALTSVFAGMQIAPQTFNTLSDWNTAQVFKLATITFLVNGTLSAAAYLKQSPLPPA